MSKVVWLVQCFRTYLLYLSHENAHFLRRFLLQCFFFHVGRQMKAFACILFDILSKNPLEFGYSDQRWKPRQNHALYCRNIYK